MAFAQRLAFLAPSALGLAALLVGPSRAEAQAATAAPGATAAVASGGVSLSWSAPAGCPTREDVLAEVTRLLGGKIDPEAHLGARGEIAAVGGSEMRLTISLGGEAARRPRKVDAPTCAELGEVAALILALAIDPIRAASAPARPGGSHVDAPPLPPPPGEPVVLGPVVGGASIEGPVTGEGTTSRPVIGGRGPATSGVAAGKVGPGESGDAVSNTGILSAGSGEVGAVGGVLAPVFVPPVFAAGGGEPAATRPAATPDLLRAHVLFAGDAGTFPAPAAGLRAGASFSSGALRVEAAGTFSWGGRILAPGSTTKGGEFWFASGAARVCREGELSSGPRAIAAAACGGVEAGATFASSFGVTEPGRGEGLWIAPGVGAMLRVPLAGRVAVRLDLELVVPVVRSSFRIVGLGDVHEPGVVAGRLGAGLEVDLARP